MRTETDRFTRNKEEWFKHQNYKGNDSFGAEFVGSIARSSLMKVSAGVDYCYDGKNQSHFFLPLLLFQLDIFTNLDVSFIEQLSMSMHGERHPAGARVIEAGEEANCMYFIMTGTVEVVGMSDQVHAEIGEGSFFGEVGILFEVKRTASIRCKTECTLLKLTKENLNKVSKEYPDISEKIKREADERHKLYIARASQRRNSTELFDIEVNEQNLKKVK